MSGDVENNEKNDNRRNEANERNLFNISFRTKVSLNMFLKYTGDSGCRRIVV